MEIIGVPHADYYVDIIDEYILQKYPTLESIMLELAPWQNEVSFFNVLNERWKERGARIIYGDIARKKPSAEFSQLHKSRLFPNTFSGWKRLAADCYHLASTVRNKGMATVLLKEQPQVTVLGRQHCDYLKKRYDSLYYTAFQPEGVEKLISEDLIGRFFLSPYPRNANQVFSLPPLRLRE